MIELYHGDCLIEMNKIADKSVDMILADLPYGVSACKWDIIIPFEPLWEQYKRVIKDNGAIVLFGSEPFSSHLRLSNLKWYKYDWVWEKHKPSNFALAKKQPMKYHENICVFYNKQVNYYPQLIKRDSERVKQGQKNKNKHTSINKGELNSLKTIQDDYFKYNADLKLPSTVLKFNAVQSNASDKTTHPTQKPVALLEYLIKTYTNEGDTVLDNVMGSGSTGVACINTNRNFIGIEMDETYFQIAKYRIEGVK